MLYKPRMCFFTYKDFSPDYDFIFVFSFFQFSLFQPCAHFFTDYMSGLLLVIYFYLASNCEKVHSLVNHFALPVCIFHFIVNLCLHVGISNTGLILGAMKEWTDKVPCLRFVQRTSQKGYLNFFRGLG